MLNFLSDINTYFGIHNHTHYSNLRLLDSINRPKDLIQKAKELGLSGIAITDHEALCGHMEINKIAKEMQATDPDFTIALGNEIYLTDTRDSGQKYYHFLLIAKDEIGHRILRELSSIAWYNMYSDRGMERVPLLKSELVKTINKIGRGHLIATSACAGGELSVNALAYALCRQNGDDQDARCYYNNIINFLEFCKDIFADDFYIECAPSNKKDQILINATLYNIAQYFHIPMVVGTDAHYLTIADRYVHKAYLTSSNGEREVDDFYEFARLMDANECRELLKLSFNNENIIDELFKNTLKIQSQIKFYSLEHHQEIPEVDVFNYPRREPPSGWEQYSVLKQLFQSSNIQERYWVNACYEALKKMGKENNTTYLVRLNEEARVKQVIGEKLSTCMFAYPNTLQHYINLFWECGSTVGAGRGSACSGLNHYLLGITQLDPIEWNLPFWRYLNDERVELGDIDLDLAPSKLPNIFKAIRQERGELGLVQVCTYGTEGTKSAILTACRGYRSPEYPNGIDTDDAQYISSLVPVERGFLWSLNDLVNGNPSKDRKPHKLFINTVNQYPGLLSIIAGIEGLVNKRGSHASGVILFDQNKIYDSAAIMRTPSGTLVTQWDLHNQEAAGSVKYDFLLTAVQDIIIQTIKLLQQDNLIDPKLSLREVYNKYLHPNVLPRNDIKMWNALANNQVINCFQFDSPVGAQAAKKIKPQSPMEMADANGLMRLMTAEPGAEMPIDKYVRFKNNINLWYQEMTQNGLTIAEQKTLEPYFLSSYGVPPSQEQLMKMLMDPNICHFTLKEANEARKIVGKKQMDKIPALQNKVLTQASSPQLGKYVWKYGLGPQMGYSFSIIHALAYSFVGMQTLYLATHFNPIYWNCACLIVNSGSLDTNISGKENESTDYAKIAKAIGNIKAANITVDLADINHSQFGFSPDAKTNRILFGLKGMLNVGDDIVNQIIENRPYSSPKDFYQKVKPKRQAMISLIKGGAFDSMMEREDCMIWYIWETCDKKNKLTLQNMPTLINYNLLPNNTEEQKMAFRIYEFNKYLKAMCKNNQYPTHYILDTRAIDFLVEIKCDDHMEMIGQDLGIGIKVWDKIYQKKMDIFREWLKANHDDILQKLNSAIFYDDWKKYIKKNNYSAWEMEVLCFYYHDHELKKANLNKYGIQNFFDLPKEPEVEYSYPIKDKIINIYKLHKICGTCIAKNKAKSTVTLLTPNGVIDVKFNKEHFSLFDKQISEKQENGKKKVMERSFFQRGSMIVVTGIRSDDMFICKKYKNTPGHRLYKIEDVAPNGDLTLRGERYKGEMEEDEL